MTEQRFSKAAMDAEDDLAIDRPRTGASFEDISRRAFLAATAGGAAMLATRAQAMAPAGASTLSFEGLSQRLDERFHTAANYTHDVVIRWGDPVLPGAPRFDYKNQTAKAQAGQFGTNNDFLAFFGLKGEPDRALLVVNHEFAEPDMMFPGFTEADAQKAELWRITQMALGLSVVELERKQGSWLPAKPGRFNRRITAHTRFDIMGPARGSDRMKTKESEGGTIAHGTYGNCAGGVTPWGTVLSAEENIQSYFMGDPSATSEAQNYKDFGIKGEGPLPWALHDDRWNIDKSPLEPNHMGWMVEIDPFSPDARPVKRTALGRFKHEGAGVVVNADNRIVVYMGDDQRFEYLYKFVSKDAFDPANPRGNPNLLDEGTLYVAEFTDSEVIWHPLVYGEGEHTQENGFTSQADVVIEARRAADLVGATPMDRPEDVDVNPVNGRAYAIMTNNTKRAADDTNAPNPRGPNKAGHILEIAPRGGDHAADRADWTMFLMGGPLDGEQAGTYNPQTGEDGWLFAPDNCAFDRHGRMLIATDGAPKAGVADGVWMCDVDGPGRALTKRLLATPVGAELCGPCLTPDDRTLFCAVQHPGSGSSADNPSTRWPDFDRRMPPRSSVVAVRHFRNKVIGS